jgi:hypothetical protein
VADINKQPSSEPPKSSIIIKPIVNSPQEIKKIINDIQQLQCPKPITIHKIKAHANTLEVRTDSEPSKQALKQYLLTSKLSTSTTIEDKRPLTSKLIFYNLHPSHTTEDELHNAVQQRLRSPVSTFEVIKKIASSKRQDTEHWVVSLPRRAARDLLSLKFIFMGFLKIYLRNYAQVKRCTRCQRLGHHTASTCTAEVQCCSQCGQNHHFTQCTADYQQCVNCCEYNSNIRSSAGNNYDIYAHLVNEYHSAASSTCPCYIYIYNQQLNQHK